YKRLSRDLSRYVASLKEKKEIRILKHIGQHHWNVHGKLSTIGDTQVAVFYCSFAVNIGKLEQGAFTYRNFDDTPLVNFETFYAESPLLRNTIANAKKFGEKALPVLIYGKMGSGKDLIAYATSSNSPLRDAPLVIIDCRFMTDQQWKILFENADSPLGYSNYTIYFKNMHFLTEKQAQSLEVYLDNTSVYKRNRLMFSYVPGHESSFDSGSLLYYIHNKIGALSLGAPSLNDYAEDIPSLATLFLNELNVEFGKQVIGFEEDAMEALRQFHWEFNIEQFRRVMRELIVLTDSNYINLERVRSVLKNQISQHTTDPLGLQLNGTLDDIVSNVIRGVLAQEGMNQSKAAKRLGISRSTMWRKLREH
ncbi:MAG: sigma 54-interacting transcriptional regulator, partial [Synergistaceae bacterium]|nr:sigma 54-interacting transcriptional regulator [Synergistaceae bacterium]